MRYYTSKIMIFPYILYCGGQPCPPQYTFYIVEDKVVLHDTKCIGKS